MRGGPLNNEEDSVMQHAIRSTVLGFAGALALAAADGAAQDIEGSFSRTLEVETPLELDVRTGAGSITISEGTGSEVTVLGEIRAWRADDATREAVRAIEADPPIELEGDRLVIGRLEDHGFRRISISYEITVPAQTRVVSRTGSGRQAIAGVDGDVNAAAGSGMVQVRDVQGDVRGSTGSGAVELENVGGNVDASTGSGRIRASGIAGAFKGSAGSGSIALEQTASGPVDLTTGSGSVRVQLPADAPFELDARAGSGSVSTDRPITVQGRLERNTLRGSAGTGGPLIRVRTGSGSIRIE